MTSSRTGTRRIPSSPPSTPDAVIKLKDDDAVAAGSLPATTARGSDVVMAEKRVRVAYLQITIAKRHKIDLTKLKELNKIFDPTNSDKPMVVVLCPSLDESKVVRITQRDLVLDAQEVCNVYVGHKLEVGLDWKSIGQLELAARAESKSDGLRRSKRLRGISATDEEED